MAARAHASSTLVVGEISDGTAVLTSDALEVVRMPLALLPHPLAVGAVVDLHSSINPRSHAEREQSVMQIQHALCERLRLPPPDASADDTSQMMAQQLAQAWPQAPPQHAAPQHAAEAYDRDSFRAQRQAGS